MTESFFQLPKLERIRRKVYATRDKAREEEFNYIEFFYDRSLRHGNYEGLSPVTIEKQH